jgi:anti-anti-sigma regulatory factor
VRLSLETDGPLAALRVAEAMAIAETETLAGYLRVARENGAVRCLIDFSECTQAPTTLLPLLLRETATFRNAGGALVLTGVRDQNPFLAEAVASEKLTHLPSFDEAIAKERARRV